MQICNMTCGITGRFGLDKGYAMLKEAGFEAIDWGFNDVLTASKINAGEYRDSIFHKSLEEMLQYFAPELEAQKKYGITVSQAHAPFPAWSAKDPELFPQMLEIYENCVRLCDAVGCKNLVIHGICGEPGDEKIEELNWKMYTGLIPVLQETQVTVCLENLFQTVGSMGHGTRTEPGHCADPEEAVSLIDRLNEAAGKECFGLCLDTGHLHLLRRDPGSYISRLGKRIKALHIHDNNGAQDQHVAPYNGNICWQKYWEALKAAGYEGDLSFETFAQIIYIREDELIPSQLKAIQAVGELMRKKLQA